MTGDRGGWPSGVVRWSTVALTACLTVTPPAAAQIQLTQVVRGLELPVALTHAGDGSGRLFVVEQPGRIRILDAGAISATPFLDI